MKSYFFPLNYKYDAKLLGIIEYKVLLPISVFIGFVIFILYSLKIDFFISFGIVIVLSLPPILLLSYGINGQPSIPYIISIIRFKASQKTYIYRKF